MKKNITVNFVDFWPNFLKNDNYFFNILSTKYHIEIDESDPDLLFFSVGFNKNCEREKYRFSRSKKIFFTGENIRPNLYSSCDYCERGYSVGYADFSFSFDGDSERNYRLPLWILFIDWFASGKNFDRDISHLIDIEDLTNRRVKSKSKFCNFVFSNSCGKRLEILDCIMRYKKVDCAGSLRNNLGSIIPGRGDQLFKIDFLKDYKFTIAAENSQYPGYITEKILHPLSVGSIPIYWGSTIIQDFNKMSFIDADSFLSEDDLLDEIISLDTSFSRYEEFIARPIFENNAIPPFALPENVLRFFEDKILC